MQFSNGKFELLRYGADQQHHLYKSNLVTFIKEKAQVCDHGMVRFVLSPPLFFYRQYVFPMYFLIMLVRLFSVCAVVPIFITFGGASEFQDTYHGFLYFLTFLFFSVVSLYCWCKRNTGRHFIGFLLAKIKGWDRNNRDKN